MYYFIYNGEKYTFDPRNPLLEGFTEEGEAIIGSQTLQESLGMTDEEADAAHLEGLRNEFIRPERDRLLAESDWTQFNDSPLTDEKKTEWQTYRQALRDITEGFDNDTEIVWPTEPS